ncbi:MAG TPA: hypothetical protein VHQ65_06665, partial [Thermoanaerobaculia bacterium]|nr:hypothetical protein [Thermoanaerobaculia bacterium]
ARAVAAALAEAGLEAADVDLLSLGANGSVAGDAREVDGLARVFGERLADLPAAAVKSMLGEPLGAGGALQALAAMAALTEGRLPGIRGFGHPGEGLVPSVDAAARPLEEGVRTALVTALDFDGGACAVVLSLGEA